MPAVHTTISIPPELLARAAAVRDAAPIRPSLSAVLVAAIRAGLPGLEALGASGRTDAATGHVEPGRPGLAGGAL